MVPADRLRDVVNGVRRVTVRFSLPGSRLKILRTLSWYTEGKKPLWLIVVSNYVILNNPHSLRCKLKIGRSRWPRGLRRRYAAARLLRLWARIPTGVWKFVCCECCVLSGRGLCDELITHPEESYQLWWVVVCDLETSWMRRPWPTGGLSRKEKNLTTEQDTTAVTISSQLCSFPSLTPLWSLTFECLFWLGSPFLKKTGSLQASPSKISFSTRNICIPLHTTTTRKII